MTRDLWDNPENILAEFLQEFSKLFTAKHRRCERRRPRLEKSQKTR
jgi:hypothetical protein